MAWRWDEVGRLARWWEPCAVGLPGCWQVWRWLAERLALGLPRYRVEPG